MHNEWDPKYRASAGQDWENGRLPKCKSKTCFVISVIPFPLKLMAKLILTWTGTCSISRQSAKCKDSRYFLSGFTKKLKSLIAWVGQQYLFLSSRSALFSCTEWCPHVQQMGRDWSQQCRNPADFFGSTQFSQQFSKAVLKHVGSSLTASLFHP